jgi:PKD repeat protein
MQRLLWVARPAVALTVLFLLAGCGGAGHPGSRGTTRGGGRFTTASAGEGTLVYVVKNGTAADIGEMKPDGSGAHLLPIGGPLCCYAPELSPDGTHLVTAGEGVVLVSAADGSGQKAIWTSPIDHVDSPVWSPDGKYIAFGTTRGGDQPGAPPSQLFVVAPDGTGLRQVTTGVGIRDIAWSPDGQTLAFLQNQAGISTVSASGGAVTLVYGPAQGEPSDALEGRLSWSPAPAMLYAQGSPENVYSYRPGDASEVELMAHAGGPSWAPDGEHFAAVVGGRIVIGSAAGGLQKPSPAIGPANVLSVSWGGGVEVGQLPPGSLHPVAFDLTAATFLSTTGTTASLTDSDHTGSVNQLKATIDWGDGTPPTPGDINVDNDSARCPCGVSGTHTYLGEGTYAVTTSITKTDRPGHLVQTVSVRSTATVTWGLIHAVQSERVVRGVSWPGAQAILSWAMASGAPAGATATIDWGDGSEPTTMVIPGPSFLTALTGLARGFDDVGLSSAHTYSTSGSYRLSVTVSAPGHMDFTAAEEVEVDPAAVTFIVSPSVPHAEIPGSPASPALLEPNPQSPTGTPVTEYDWDFGDGTKFVDSPRVEAAWAAMLAEPGSGSPDRSFIGRALSLGIDITLSGHVDPKIGMGLWTGLFSHTVPHIFLLPQGYRITLTEKTASGTVVGTQDMATQTTCALWADGLFGGATVCDTARGWDTVTSRPNRWPDYYMYLVNLGTGEKGLAVNASAGIIVASTGDVYISYGAAGGLGVSTESEPGAQVAFAVGFVEAPDGPKPDPSVITDYIGGWSVNAAVAATLGPLGGSEAIVWSPAAGLGGEEYYLTAQSKSVSLSLTAGYSCAMHLGNISQADLAGLASLAPGPTGPWPWEPGGPIPTVSPGEIAQLLSIGPPSDQLATCAHPIP